MMSGWLLRVHGLMCHQKRHLYVMILKQYVEVHVYLNHFINMWHTKNMLLELIQTPLCLFETFDYFEIGIGLIQGVKCFFFFTGVGDELIWIAASCVHEDGVPWVGSCDHSNQHLHLFLPRFVQIIMLEVN